MEILETKEKLTLVTGQLLLAIKIKKVDTLFTTDKITIEKLGEGF